MKRYIFLFVSLLLLASMLMSACASTAPISAEKEVPAAEAKEEAPAVEAKEEAPAVEVKEEAPTAETKEEASAVEAKEEAPAAEAKEEPATDFDWRMFEGEKIRVAMATQPWTQFLEPYIPEFEELTGIETTYEILPEDQFRQKTTVEFAAGTSDVDVFVSMVAQEGIKYDSAGWYVDLEEMLANTKITNPNFNFDDFTDSGVLVGRLSNDKLVGLPVYNETGVLFYNKELFDQAGVPYPPKTIEDVEAAATAIHNPADGIYGICLRGKGAAATSQFASFLHTFGSDWVDANGQANVLDPAFLDAVKWYGGMLNKYGPPGATSYHWQQCQDIFLQGKAGMWFDANVFFSNLVDPEQSKIVDKVAVAQAPIGPGGPDPTVSGWVLSIYNGSQHKDAAWLFVQWALGKEMVERAQLANITTGRVSAWQSAQYQTQNQYPEVADVILNQLAASNPNWNPPVLNVGEARDSIGTLIIEAIDGGDVDALAPDVNTKLQELLDETPKLK
ncbi:MAG: sugar ABC transporter substrate-binding protein [Anaerolineae bacterium]|nr:sugar ABC transporter substrate-binding protein [Anaerolineae bacterium]